MSKVYPVRVEAIWGMQVKVRLETERGLTEPVMVRKEIVGNAIWDKLAGPVQPPLIQAKLSDMSDIPRPERWEWLEMEIVAMKSYDALGFDMQREKERVDRIVAQAKAEAEEDLDPFADEGGVQVADMQWEAPVVEHYEEVAHPDHYNWHPKGIECIDVIEEFPFNLASALKYIWRAGWKPSTTKRTDLEKALWYLQRELERTPPL